MNKLQPFCQQRPIVEYCEKHNIVIQAYCPVIRGKLDNPLFLELAKKVSIFRTDGVILLKVSRSIIRRPPRS